MKSYVENLSGVLVLVFWPVWMLAQDVFITIPTSNIINSVEYSTMENVLYTDHNKWRRSGKTFTYPTFTTLSTPVFRHRRKIGVTLPADILQFRLQSIGGKQAPFHHLDTWPGFKVFSSSPQAWYEPGHPVHKRGNVNFTFKIPAFQFDNKMFIAGDYAMEITHNYGGSFKESFTPERFSVVLSIPTVISWLSASSSKYIKVTTLNDFRLSSAHIFGDLGRVKISHTVDLNLWCKASSSSINFTSSKGESGSIPISVIRLGSEHPNLLTTSLTTSWQKYSAFRMDVKEGNQTDFNLQLSVSARDFKNYFFEAGTYTFRLNLDAKNTDYNVSALQNRDVTVEVAPLSEIVIPSGQIVNFNFNTEAHYRKGQSKVMSNHIILSNNENFELYVRSGTTSFMKNGTQSDIKSNILQVREAYNALRIPLSITPQKIIINREPLLDQKFDIEYTIPGNSAQELVSKEKTTYSIDVIYSFTAL